MASFPSLRSDVLSREHTFPSNYIRPYSGVVRRCNSYTYNCQFRRSWTKLSPFRREHLKIAPSVKLRRLSEFIRAESGKFSARSRSMKDNGELLAQGHRVPPAGDTATELQSIVICFSLQTRNVVLNGAKSLYCSLLRYQSVIADLFLSPIFLYLKIIDPRPLLNLVKIYGRILLFGLIFVALDLTPGRMSSRHALAAPPATSTESQKRPQVEMAKQLRRDGQKFRDTTDKYEERLSGLSSPESGSAFFDQQIEAISVADRKQLEAHLELLKQEASVLENEVHGAVREFLDTKAELERVRDDVLKSEKEESLKKKAGTIVNFRRRLLEIVASLTKISQRMKQLGSSRQADVEQDAVSVQSKIATDLEQLKSILREQTLLPQAAKIEPEDDGSSADIQEVKTILEQMELEQIISQKLSDVLEKLVARLDDSNEEETDLEQSMSELKDLILTDARWRDGDIELRNDIIHNGDSIKRLSPKEQEDILVTRDRLLNSTWYNERKKRWEMDPRAALLAVQKKLAGRARVRHDRCIMYLSLKGDEREYVVNTKAFNAEYEDYGGFQTLYLKLLASGVPTSVEVMWIPLEEWPTERLLQLPFKMVWWLLEDFWNSNLVVSVRPWYYKTAVGAVEEVMIRFGFPTIQRIVPQKIRVLLGFELAEGAEAAEPTDIIIWQQEAQKHVDARYAEGSGSYAWWISLPVRCYVVGLPLLIVLRYVVGLFIAPFRPQPLAMNDREWKEKKQEELIKKLDLQPKKQTIDPIRNIFDNMKRVRRPEVSLKDFAGIDIIKEEINEIISFLKNPKLFREMGARPPRGVLIVGESGTGKTALALAIAAEARVPMVEVQGSELEGGAWVGQGASNVRELFKTAREMAPLIIFMDDFDHFAGVRGATSDTRKQDHESLINQLLVELDGFETQEGVVLVATTSRPFAIDEALRRPGRMDRTIQLPMPNKQEREQILRQAARRTMDADLVDYVDWAKVAEKTAGLTPARLKYVPEGLEGSAVSFKIADEEELFFIFEWLAKLNKASPKWLKESKFTKRYNDMLIDWLGLRVTKEDLEDAVEYLDVFGQSRPGIELYDPPYVWTREFKFPHAVWAAGKGLIALLLPDFDEVDIIWLDATSWEGIAFTKFTKKLEGGYQETGTLTRSYCEKELVSYFGSFVASRMLLPFGENNSLCKFELESAKEVATRMVMEYGWASDDSPMIYMTDGSASSTAMGDKHEAEVADKINQLFFRACDKASQILEQNRPVLEAMLEHLLEYDVINKEVSDIAHLTARKLGPAMRTLCAISDAANDLVHLLLQNAQHILLYFPTDCSADEMELFTQDLTRILNEKGAVFEEGPFSLLPFTHTEIVGITTNGSGRSGKESPMSAIA